MSPTERRPAPHATRGELAALIDGELSATRRADLRAHLDECERCAAQLADVTEGAAFFAASIESVDVPAPDPSVALVRRRALVGRVRRGVGATAALVVISAGALLALQSGPFLQARFSDPDPPAAPGDRWVTRFAIASPDTVDIIVPPVGDSLVVVVEGSASATLEVASLSGAGLGGVELGGGDVTLRPGEARLLRVRVPAGTPIRVRTTEGDPPLGDAAAFRPAPGLGDSISIRIAAGASSRAP